MTLLINIIITVVLSVPGVILRISDNKKEGILMSIGDTFEQTLIDKGFAATRADDIRRALGSLHAAICDCDINNRQLIATHYPEALKLAREYIKSCPIGNQLSDADIWRS
jgi:hypothetical protein|tara:strand:- start:397 stop:726 length:330 start_codon:yes stop_codon:yes gene_type:complete